MCFGWRVLDFCFFQAFNWLSRWSLLKTRELVGSEGARSLIIKVMLTVLASLRRATATLFERFTLSRRSSNKSSVKLDVSETQRGDESGVKIEGGLLSGQKTVPHFTNLWWAEASKMTIRDYTALMETGLKSKRQVENSELIRERKDKLFNLSQFQNGSQRIS